MKFLTKDEVIAQIPYPIPKPFCDFDEDWVNFIKKLDGKEITLSYPFDMPDLSRNLNKGWYFTSIIKPPSFIASWIPTAWISKSSKENLCKCETFSLFYNGCQCGGN